MKLNIKNYVFISLLAVTNAMASGNHAGGHNDESNAIGQAGKADEVTRSVDIDMTDKMRFNPASIKVKQGETIRFNVYNSGKLKHEMVLGTEAELKEHYEVMKKFPEMEHADANQVTVQPGKSGEIIWTFSRAGTINFACLQPGHYDAGMKGTVTVTNKVKQKKVENHDAHTH